MNVTIFIMHVPNCVMGATPMAAYNQVYFRLGFFMEANSINPDQTAPLGAD